MTRKRKKCVKVSFTTLHFNWLNISCLNELTIYLISEKSICNISCKSAWKDSYKSLSKRANKRIVVEYGRRTKLIDEKYNVKYPGILFGKLATYSFGKGLIEGKLTSTVDENCLGNLFGNLLNILMHRADRRKVEEYGRLPN